MGGGGGDVTPSGVLLVSDCPIRNATTQPTIETHTHTNHHMYTFFLHHFTSLPMVAARHHSTKRYRLGETVRNRARLRVSRSPTVGGESGRIPLGRVWLVMYSNVSSSRRFV